MFITALPVPAIIRNVPDDYATIQAGIDAAVSGDTVYVKAGYYNEKITLKSYVKVIGAGYKSTWIYGGGSGSTVFANNAINALLEGFSIYGAGSESSDAGIKIYDGSVIVSKNRIYYNTNGMYIYGESYSIIKNNLIYRNGDTSNAVLNYGLICLHSTVNITNNLIYDNYETAVYIGWEDSSDTTFINNTVVDNGDNGIWCYKSSPTIKNNIFTGNSTGISASHDGKPSISYNDVYGNTWRDYDAQSGGEAAPGTGDISENALFANQSGNDFFLLEGSPCIDAGDPNPIYNDPTGDRNDMGAYGGECSIFYAFETGLSTGFVFTSIGQIPVSEIDQTGTRAGLVNVSAAVADDLHIPQYVDSAFGSFLWLNGQFGIEDESVRYYQILVAKWPNSSTPPSADSFVPLEDNLTKIRYTVLSSGQVIPKRYHVGPLGYGGLKGLYSRTNDGYYAHPDLKLIWDTGNFENGKYEITCKGYNSSYSEVSLPVNDNTSITLVVNNTPVEAQIHEVYHNGTLIQECDIIDMDPVDNLLFFVTARHPQGLLRSYDIEALYGKNHSAGYIISATYSPGRSPVWYGISNTGQDTGDINWEECAYQFRLRVRARITNGFNYIYSREFNDHYFIQTD